MIRKLDLLGDELRTVSTVSDTQVRLIRRWSSNGIKNEREMGVEFSSPRSDSSV